MTADPPPLFTVESLAEYLHMKPETIRKWRGSNPRRGPRAVLIGTQVRFRWEDVDAWLQDQLEAWGTEPGPGPGEEGFDAAGAGLA